jgi:hypothetical protein
MFNPYTGYNGAMQNPYGFQPIATQQLQQEQVTQVNGRASVEQIQLAPNSSKLVMDTTAPIVWLCVSDGVGRVTATPYDITEHKDAPPVDVAGIEQRLSTVEAYIAQQMEAANNVKSNAQPPASEQRSSGNTYNNSKRDR